MYEGMRIAKQELNELALNGDRLIFEVRRGERVVCQRLCTGGEQADRKSQTQVTLHRQLQSPFRSWSHAQAEACALRMTAYRSAHALACATETIKIARTPARAVARGRCSTSW